MQIRRITFVQPYRQPEDFPTHLTGDRAAELLSAATAPWHPALIAATGELPGARATDDLSDPSELHDELFVMPTVSRHRLSADWYDRLRSTTGNPPPVDAAASRQETIAAVLSAAGISDGDIDPEIIADFLALGFAHLQVELLTRTMHYTSVLDTDQFASAVVSAARAAVAGENATAHEELARAFDLLADARNHVYSVDYYVVDVTLLAESTLGEELRIKLAANSPTSILASGRLLDKIAGQYPNTLVELRRAVDAGVACVAGGTYHDKLHSFTSPEHLLDELNTGRDTMRRHFDREFEVFAQFHTSFSTMLPEVLHAAGFHGALHASFDGGRLPKADQSKTRWGNAPEVSIETLASRPMDISRPETWLKLAQRIGDTIAHDHVATVLLAGWPGSSSEYYDDLRRAAKYGTVLGKLITLDEYFRTTREVDEWTTFNPREYRTQSSAEAGADPISSHVVSYRRDVLETHSRMASGLIRLVGAAPSDVAELSDSRQVAINPWNFPCTQFVGADPIGLPSSEPAGFSCRSEAGGLPVCLPDVPGFGFATSSAAAPVASIALAEGRTLRNEKLEVTVSETTGGIQSLRTHRDRGTRASQRLVYQSGGIAAIHDSQMVAEHVEITHNDAWLGEITSRGSLLDSAGEKLAGFIQKTRVARGVSAAFVDVELETVKEAAGDIWRTYFASRLACSDEAIAVRRGRQWMAVETAREKIESPEWVEINDGIGTVTIFSLGLPFHRRATGAWLDTLLCFAGETERRFQFALAIDEPYPGRAAFGFLTAGQGRVVTLSNEANASRGWFLHIGAKNVLVTHIEPLTKSAVGGLSEAEIGINSLTPSASETPPTSGIGVRLRLLETEGRDVQTALTAFRPFRAAQLTDFRGNSTGVLSVVGGRVDFDIAAHRWIQIEAEW